MKMRFLDVALSCMPFIPDTGADGMGTDGLYLYYDPQYLGGLFREDRVMVNRIYLHLVLHGIFRHMLRRKEEKSGFIIWPAILWQNPSSTGFSTAV